MTPCPPATPATRAGHPSAFAFWPPSRATELKETASPALLAFACVSRFPAGTRLLHAACFFANVDAILLLLEAGDSIAATAGCGVAPATLLDRTTLQLLQDPVKLQAHMSYAGDVWNPAAPPAVFARLRQPKTMLRVAISLGCSGMVQRMLLSCSLPDVNEPNVRGQSALAVALRLGHIDIADRLLAHGADPNSTDRDGVSPAYTAVVEGAPLSILVAMIGNGLSVRQVYNIGGAVKARLLQVAAMHGRIDVVAMLLNHGDSLDEPGQFARPADLFPSTATALFGAPDRFYDYMRSSKVPTSVRLRDWYGKLIQLLLGAGLIDAECLLYLTSSLGIIATVRELLSPSSGPVSVARVYGGRTALVAAFDHGHNDIADLLLDHGADPNPAAKQPVAATAVTCPSVGFLALKNSAPPELFAKLIEKGMPPLTKLSRVEVDLVMNEHGIAMASKSRLLHLAAKLGLHDHMMILVALGGDRLTRSRRCSAAPVAALPQAVRPIMSGLRSAPSGVPGLANDTCSICLDDMCLGELVVKLKCGHGFHLACCAGLIRHAGLKCPLCRKALVAKMAGPASSNPKPGRRTLLPSACRGCVGTARKKRCKARAMDDNDADAGGSGGGGGSPGLEYEHDDPTF